MYKYGMYKYDGVDAPPDGIAMCQDGAEAIRSTI